MLEKSEPSGVGLRLIPHPPGAKEKGGGLKKSSCFGPNDTRILSLKRKNCSRNTISDNLAGDELQRFLVVFYQIAKL